MKNKKQLRVLQVLPALEMGGVERGTVDVALFLKRKNHFPVVASSGGRLVSHLRQSAIIHEYMPLHSKNPFVIWANIYRLCDIIKKHGIQIVHARSRAPAWSAYFAAKKCGVPFVTTFHGTYPFQTKLKKLYNSVMTKGRVVIAVSKFIAQEIHKKYGTSQKKIVTIHRGVDLGTFDSKKVTESMVQNMISEMQLPEDKHIFLLPGRLTRIKGHEVLFEAVSRMKRDDFICLVVGSFKNKNYLRELDEQARHYGFRDRLYIFNDCKDMATLYALATAAISPSTRPETFGRTAAEAGAMGCIVIGSNHGGTKEIIVDGKTGFLFESENSIQLAEIMDKVLEFTQEQRKEIQKNAIEHVRSKFDNETMLAKTLRVYQTLI